MDWHIEYTNHPFVAKKNRKILEKAVIENIREIERLLKNEESDGFVLGETNFYVESNWLKSLKKHHIAVRSLKGNAWVATIIFEDHPTMSIEEVKSTLRKMGFGEYDLHGLSLTNDETLGEFIAELEEKLSMPDREERAKNVDLINLKLLEGFLEKGIIKLNDGLLDAFRKIDRYIQSHSPEKI